MTLDLKLVELVITQCSLNVMHSISGAEISNI